jgi:hypothetical protein
MQNINDKIIGIVWVQLDGLQLDNLNVDLKNDDDVVNAAVEQNPMALQFANERFKNDRELALRLVARDGVVLNLLSQALKKEKQLALTAIQNDGRVCFILDHTLRNDISFVWDIWRLQPSQNHDGSRWYFVQTTFLNEALKAFFGVLLLTAGIAMACTASMIPLPYIATLMIAGTMVLFPSVILAKQIYAHVNGFFKTPNGIENDELEIALNRP